MADAIRTSLGPRGMDKMIQAAKGGEVTITNDGATILKQMQVVHPAAKMVRLGYFPFNYPCSYIATTVCQPFLIQHSNADY